MGRTPAVAIQVEVQEAGQRGDEGNLYTIQGYVNRSAWVRASQLAARIPIYADAAAASDSSAQAVRVARFTQSVLTQFQRPGFLLDRALRPFSAMIKGFLVLRAREYIIVNLETESMRIDRVGLRCGG